MNFRFDGMRNLSLFTLMFSNSLLKKHGYFIVNLQTFG